MLKNDFLFVYGTLRSGERADLRKQQHSFDVAYVGIDKINGELFHLGSFPGVKTVSAEFDESLPTVVGEIFRIRNASITALLDAYEGYNAEKPYAGLYNRLQTGTERGRTAWVYTYNGLCIPEQKIESGDWCRNRQTSVSGRRMME